jgi:hypothetical protein
MNVQDIVFPIRDLVEWSFGFIIAGGDNVNNLLMVIIGGALVYWTAQLIKFNKDEVPNR